tara:strand:+ start:641 stop:1015 length:375 start_codon:yes stop_codon:yes gene_type:complete
MVSMPVHDWRPGDRVVSIARNTPTSPIGVGILQRTILDKAIILWDDGSQTTERLIDLIFAGFDTNKDIKDAESVFGQSQGSWWGDDIILSETNLPLIDAKLQREIQEQQEQIAITRSLLSGVFK